jgi:hypothetical protein
MSKEGDRFDLFPFDRFDWFFDRVKETNRFFVEKKVGPVQLVSWWGQLNQGRLI